MNINIGEQLKKLRDEKGKTLKEVAKVTGLSDSYINLMENNKREPTISALKKLAPYYGVSLGFFFSEDHTSNDYIGLEILHARESKNMTPSELAEKLGTDILRIGMLETGTIQPTEEEKQKLNEIFNISMEKSSKTDVTKNIQTIREACYKLGLESRTVNYIVEFINSLLTK